MRVFPEIDSLCFCAKDAMIAVTISLDTLLVSMPCSSNRTLTPSSFSSRTAARQSFRISGKSGNGLDQNAVDFSFAAILHHALEIFALFNRRAGDALIGVNIDHFPIRIAGDEFGIVLILHAVGVELILAGGADAGIRCDAQLPRDDLVVRWDYNDALLFQRKISVGLLFCHVVHLPLQQHTLPHQGQ